MAKKHIDELPPVTDSESTVENALVITEDTPKIELGECGPTENAVTVWNATVRMEAMYTRITFDINGKKIVTPLVELPDEERVIAVRRFPPNVTPAQISVGRAMTLSMGNYESAKVSGTVTLPCVLEELHGAAYDGWGIVDKMLREKVQVLIEHRVKKGD